MCLCVFVCVRCSLLEHCRRHRYLSQSGEELALLLSSQLENLLAYRTITHDESPEHRMSCTVNVLVGPRPRPRPLPARCSPEECLITAPFFPHLRFCRTSTRRRRGRTFTSGESPQMFFNAKKKKKYFTKCFQEKKKCFGCRKGFYQPNNVFSVQKNYFSSKTFFLRLLWMLKSHLKKSFRSKRCETVFLLFWIKKVINRKTFSWRL